MVSHFQFYHLAEPTSFGKVEEDRTENQLTFSLVAIIHEVNDKEAFKESQRLEDQGSSVTGTIWYWCIDHVHLKKLALFWNVP